MHTLNNLTEYWFRIAVFGHTLFRSVTYFNCGSFMTKGSSWFIMVSNLLSIPGGVRESALVVCGGII